MKALGAFAEAVVAHERKIVWGRRPVAHSDVHLGPHDAAGAQLIIDGPLGRIKGDDVDAVPAWVRGAGRVPQSLW